MKAEARELGLQARDATSRLLRPHTAAAAAARAARCEELPVAAPAAYATRVGSLHISALRAGLSLNLGALSALSSMRRGWVASLLSRVVAPALGEIRDLELQLPSYARGGAAGA